MSLRHDPSGGRGPAKENQSQQGRSTPGVAPTFEFEDLSGGHVEIHVIFNQQLYRLRKTRKGGLILTK